MARTVDRLTAKAVAGKTIPGLYSDGNSLYLQITAAGVKSWLFRYMLAGTARGMGLGPIHTVSLKEARDAALACRKQLQAGIDPLEAKLVINQTQKAAKAKVLTFSACTTLYIGSHRAGWKSAKHADQWKNTLTTYAFPIIGELPVAKVDTGLVMQVLEPIWKTRNETASRVRGRIESVLGWAAVRGHRQGDNPARWRDHLDKLLPRPRQVQTVQHHPALPYVEVGEFIGRIQIEVGVPARALEFLILTAARTGEVIGARWNEFDFEAKIWTVPAARMKLKKEHRVALADRAVAIVKLLQTTAQSEYVFPGRAKDKPLSNMGMLQLLKRLDRGDLTAHGFRSTFRDWAGETTNYPREVCEAALAHGIKDQVEAAYARGDLFAKRKLLMADWAVYCGKAGTTDACK